MQLPQPSHTRLLIVDDERELLEVLGAWFANAGYVVHTAADGVEALRLLNEQPFDVVVTDLRMPGLNGLQLLAVAKELDPRMEVVFLTGHGTMDDAIAALREGRAFDFITKPLKNLRQLHLVVEKALARREAEGPPAAEPLSSPTAWPAHVGVLSTRELGVMALVARGLDNRAIAGQLGLSEKTVKNYLGRIYEKLHVKSRTQALAFLRDHGHL